MLQICFVVALTNCSNTDNLIVEEEAAAVVVTDSWICDIESIVEDDWIQFQIHMDESGDYVAISQDKLLKVSKDGFLNSVIILNLPDSNYGRFRFYKDKIYRFHTANNSSVNDPTIPMQLDIYDFDFNLVASHVLDTNGILWDAEIENATTVGILAYDGDNNTMTLKKLDIDTGLIAERVLSTNGTKPRDLNITSSGEYYCTDSSTQDNLFLLDNNLNMVWTKQFSDYVISDSEYVPNVGIFLTGRSASSFGAPSISTIVALVDFDGNIVKSQEYNSGDRWAPYIKVSDDRICIVQTEPESGLNMLYSILDYDLNILNSEDIAGNVIHSEIIENELGSFSFVYGIAVDEDDPEFFPETNTRIFKFDDTYELPTNIIIQ